MMSRGPISESMTNFFEHFAAFVLFPDSKTLIMCRAVRDAVFSFFTYPAEIGSVKNTF